MASKQFWAMARPTSSPVDKRITNLTIFSSSTQAAVAGEACDERSGFTPAVQAPVRLTCFGSSVPDCTQGLLPISVRPMAKNCTLCWQSSGVRRHASQESLNRLEKTLIDGLPSKTQRSTSHARQKPVNYERIHRRGRRSVKCHVFGDSVFSLPRSEWPVHNVFRSPDREPETIPLRKAKKHCAIGWMQRLFKICRGISIR